MLRILSLNMGIITDLAQLLFCLQKTHIWPVVTVVESLYCECLLFLPLPPPQFWICLCRRKGELWWEWGQAACAARRAPHCHVSHSTTHLIQGGMGSPVSSFDLFKTNILLLPTAHNVFINFIYNITTLYIMFVQIYVYIDGHCIISSIIKQKYVHVLSPKI